MTDAPTLLILGGSGDVTARYLLPALAELEACGRLEDGFSVIGSGRDDWTDEHFRSFAGDGIERHGGAGAHRGRAELLERLHWASADATDADSLREVDPDGAGPVIAYLALPPTVFADAIEALGSIGLGDRLRLAVEKPFGTDRSSARSLNELLARHVDEDHVFRIDHFLGHRTAQNLIGVRFANRLFADTWNRSTIERVEIVWDETLALEGRAGYYDGTGALVDMIQNHLLQLMCLVAMEPPETLDARSLSRSKLELLRRVRGPDNADAPERTRRGRYGAGRVDGSDVPAYVHEDEVDPGLGTETFAAVHLMIDDDRWRDVPFVIRTGKALAADVRHVRVTFRDVEDPVFCRRDHQDPTPPPSRLTFDIDPDHLTLSIALNGGGDPFGVRVRDLELDFEPDEVSAYASVLSQLLSGSSTLSVGAEEAEELWRIVEPIREAWSEGLVALEEYPAGSEGPGCPAAGGPAGVAG